MVNQNESAKKTFGLPSLALKIIACLLMTLDHVALLFLERGDGNNISMAYYWMRAIGKISFPIFVFLAVEGVYHTKNTRNYLLRLFIGAIALDLFGYILGVSLNLSIGSNPLIGNAFTDMFLGVLCLALLRKKNWWSLLAVFPIAYAFLSEVPIPNSSYGTIFKTDWGAFSICLFLAFFVARELSDLYLKDKAKKDGLEKDAYLLEDGVKMHRYSEAIALVLIELIFYLVYRLDNFSMFLPNDFVPLGTYSTLAFVFFLFYNGKKGYQNKVLQYSFYFYYPFHLVILGILSCFFGVLAALR